MVFHFFAGNKLVTADHASAEYLDFRIDFLADFLCHLCEVLVCREAQNAHLRNLAERVSEDAHIHVVLNSIGRDDDIADVNFIPQGACNSGVDDTVHAVIIYKNLGADTGIYFTDSAAHNNHFFSVQVTVVELHGCFRADCNIRHHFL